MDRLSTKEQDTANKLRKMERENAAIKRQLAKIKGSRNTLPKPGPKFKAFEDLTPRDQKIASKDLRAHLLKTSEERKVHPTKLSAYLTYRYSFCLVFETML